MCVYAAESICSTGDSGFQTFKPVFCIHNSEVKFVVYGKRQTAKIKLLPSVLRSLYSRIKIFVFAVNSKGQFSSFV